MSFTKTAPDRIWLGIFSDEENPFFPADHEGICWADNQFADFNVGYVREDVVRKLEKQRDELLEFTQEVRRSGDTRIASMAIAAITKAEGGAA
jgi:hypothetical protein